MALKNLIAKWSGHCSYCGKGFTAGTKVTWDSATKAVYHTGHDPVTLAAIVGTTLSAGSEAASGDFVAAVSGLLRY